MVKLVIASLLSVVLSLFLIIGSEGSGANAQLPVPVPTITVIVPGPVETVIKELPVQVPVPGPTVTVTVPGPTVTETIFRDGEPAPTVTITETVTASAEPGTSTEMPPTGQTTESSDTVAPTPEPTPTPDPPVVREGLDDDDDIFISTPQAIGTGLLLLGIGGGLMAIFLAYYRGYKDSDKAEAKLTKRLRDDVIGE